LNISLKARCRPPCLLKTKICR